MYAIVSNDVYAV